MEKEKLKEQEVNTEIEEVSLPLVEEENPDGKKIFFSFKCVMDHYPYRSFNDCLYYRYFL